MNERQESIDTTNNHTLKGFGINYAIGVIILSLQRSYNLSNYDVFMRSVPKRFLGRESQNLQVLYPTNRENP